MKTLSIMDQATLTASSSDSNSATLRLKVNESLTVLAGGLLNCKWLDVMARKVTVESSGAISADGTGSAPKQGIGSTSGSSTVFIQF